MSTDFRKGVGPWRLLLPLGLCAAAIAAWWHGQQFDAGQQQFAAQLRASEQMAARLGVAAAEVRSGSNDGFAALAAVDAAIVNVRTALRAAAPSQALSPMAPDFAPLLAGWQEAQSAIERVRELAEPVQALEREADRLQSVATGLLVSSDELVDALIAAEAKPTQLRAAARQLMLVQRIGTNARRLLQPDAGLLAAADRMGRDAVVFGEVATALMHGSPALKILRVEDDDAREILATVGREFRVLAQTVEAVMAGGAARATLATRVQRLGEASRALDVQHALARRVLVARIDERLITPLHVVQLLALATLAIVAALGLGLAERRRQARTGAREQEQHEQALYDLREARSELSAQVEQLASDIHRIADGDLGLRAHSSSPSDAGVGVARAGLDRLRQLLARHAEDGTRLAQSGQVVGDVAQRLRETVRRHSQQAESAGQATRIMASALENLRQESALVSDAARESGVSAQRASGALGETLHELDAVRAGVEDCANRVRALEDAARELRAVRTLVEDVGELGKMLSLNVAIQASVDTAASRALSAFSDEVQRLAARARSAVTQVESIHSELRDEAERAASAVKESVWRARSAAERARGARASVEDLAGSARRLDDLNHALARSQREHAVNVTEVVRTMTALHALTREVRENVDATADSARAFGDVAARVEYRLAGPQAGKDTVIEMDAGSATGQADDELAAAVDGIVGPHDDASAAARDDKQPAASADVAIHPASAEHASKRWR